MKFKDFLKESASDKMIEILKKRGFTKVQPEKYRKTELKFAHSNGHVAFVNPDKWIPKVSVHLNDGIKSVSIFRPDNRVGPHFKTGWKELDKFLQDEI